MTRQSNKHDPTHPVLSFPLVSVLFDSCNCSLVVLGLDVDLAQPRVSGWFE